MQLFLGIEANILNENGELDLPEDLLKKQRIVTAGLHELTPFRTQPYSNAPLQLSEPRSRWLRLIGAVDD